jgi:tetratricopeptide (TPR) repeat protein
MAKVKEPLDLEQEIARLRQEVIEAVSGGKVANALELAIEVEANAQKLGEPYLIDLAACERAGIEISCDLGDAAAKKMRLLLFKSTNSEIRSRAAYNVSVFHFRQEETERADFYAKQALHFANICGEPKLLIWSNNFLGRILVVGSHFEPARSHFQKTLEVLGTKASTERALVLANLGYVDALLGSPVEAFRSCFASLRMLLALKAGPWQRLPHLVLSFTYLEIGRYDRGRQHGLRALELARQAPDGAEHEKVALYLLSEAEKLCGLDEEAYEHICELQRRFYPDQPFVVDVLCSTDVRKLVNLMA